MLGGYQILDLTMIDLNGGDIPDSPQGANLYAKVSQVTTSHKPVVLKFRLGQQIILVANYERFSTSTGYRLMFGDKQYGTTYSAEYDAGYGIDITPSGAITVINF